MDRCGPRGLLLLISAGLIAAAVPARPVRAQNGQDRVILQSNSGGRYSLTGTIVDYTGTALTLRTSVGGTLRVFPASQIVEVQTPQTEPHLKGLFALEQGEFDEAKTALEKALQEEQRTWVRREVLALLVRCALRQGEYASAGSRFLLLTRSDPETRHFHLVPLAWRPGSPAALKADARQWISETDDVARLIGASVLLDDATWGDTAESELKRLGASTIRPVRSLARAQLWRVRLRSSDLPAGELTGWEKSIEQMPEPLRAGPCYLLGRGRLKRGERERAARALLWLPLVYDQDHHLAARACLEAADALAESSRLNEAITLYQEVTVRFAETPFAKDATAALKKLASSESPREAPWKSASEP